MGRVKRMKLKGVASTAGPIFDVVPSSFFGMNVTDVSPWPDVYVGALGKKSFITWKSLETSAGVFDWTEIDAWAAAAVTHGVSLVYSFDSFPAFYDYPADLDKLETFIALLVPRLPAGSYYELWNEPWQLGAYHPGEAIADQASLVDITNTVAASVKAADPAAKLVSVNFKGGGGLTDSAYMDAYYDAGGYTATDVVAIHAYPDASLGLEPEGFAPNRYLMSGIAANMAEHGLTAQPLWVTEGSWGKATDYTPDLTTDQQVAFLARWLLMQWGSGVRRSYWYSYDNVTFGTIEGNADVITAHAAIRDWMEGATMPVTPSKSGTVWTCRLSRTAGYSALVVWDTAGDSSYTPPAGPWTKYRKLDGTETAWSSGAVTIGIKPIMFASA